MGTCRAHGSSVHTLSERRFETEWLIRMVERCFVRSLAVWYRCILLTGTYNAVVQQRFASTYKLAAVELLKPQASPSLANVTDSGSGAVRILQYRLEQS